LSYTERNFMPATALTIAGSDPSGGAGLQADLKVFTLSGVFGMAVPAALTAQGPRGVRKVQAVKPDFLQAQLDALLDDVRPDALKTGMLLSARAVEVVAASVRSRRLDNLVVDPVMVSSTGVRLLRQGAVEALIGGLIPAARLVTPNLDEAGIIAGMEVRTLGDMEVAAKRIVALGAKAALVKGGHLTGEPVDVLCAGRHVTLFEGFRVEGKRLHGTGCVYSAAITANLALGMGIVEAVGEAKRFVTEAIIKAEPVGEGRIPLWLM